MGTGVGSTINRKAHKSAVIWVTKQVIRRVISERVFSVFYMPSCKACEIIIVEILHYPGAREVKLIIIIIGF